MSDSDARARAVAAQMAQLTKVGAHVSFTSVPGALGRGMTTFAAFLQSLDEPDPPAGLDGPLLALWHAEKGDWEAAHRLVMTDDSLEAAWVHACLHRQEGDLGNAGYWYRRAGQPVAEGPLGAERRAIAEALTGGG